MFMDILNMKQDEIDELKFFDRLQKIIYVRTTYTTRNMLGSSDENPRKITLPITDANSDVDPNFVSHVGKNHV